MLDGTVVSTALPRILKQSAVTVPGTSGSSPPDPRTPSASRTEGLIRMWCSAWWAVRSSAACWPTTPAAAGRSGSTSPSASSPRPVRLRQRTPGRCREALHHLPAGLGDRRRGHHERERARVLGSFRYAAGDPYETRSPPGGCWPCSTPAPPAHTPRLASPRPPTARPGPSPTSSTSPRRTRSKSLSHVVSGW